MNQRRRAKNAPVLRDLRKSPVSAVLHLHDGSFRVTHTKPPRSRNRKVRKRKIKLALRSVLYLTGRERTWTPAADANPVSQRAAVLLVCVCGAVRAAFPTLILNSLVTQTAVIQKESPLRTTRGPYFYLQLISFSLCLTAAEWGGAWCMPFSHIIWYAGQNPDHVNFVSRTFRILSSAAGGDGIFIWLWNTFYERRPFDSPPPQTKGWFALKLLTCIPFERRSNIDIFGYRLQLSAPKSYLCFLSGAEESETKVIVSAPIGVHCCGWLGPMLLIVEIEMGKETRRTAAAS